MATRTPLECPLCREELSGDQNLEDHLVAIHSERELAKFVVAETEALETRDVAE